MAGSRTSTKAVPVKAFFALYPPVRIHSDAHYALYCKFIDEYEKPKHVSIKGSDFHDGEVLTVRTIPCTPKFHNRFFGQTQFLLQTRHVLEFSGSFNFPGPQKFFFADPKGKSIPKAEPTLRASWVYLLPTLLDVTIQTYFCALIIAFAGAVSPTGNIWHVGRRVHHFSKHYVTAVPHGIEYLRQYDSTLIKDEIDHNIVIKWIFSQAGIFDGYSNTPAAKALNYYTRLFVPDFREDELSNTVWALAGIEALLVEGGRSSAGQLREKLRAIFGTTENLEWLLSMIDMLYEFRSKMVHGNRQLKSAF